MPADVMPGFTHLQSGQPVTLGHHLLAYREMLVRDRSRFADARARMNESPLGSAALAGTGFPIDRDETAAALGFDRPTANSLDAVSDRDFVVDYLHAAALCSVHLSRLAEEIILWASQPFGFVKLPDAWSTGSSIMPNKRNPDAAELVRGHSARIVGDLVALLVLLKGLPLAYAKDLQDDKPPLFDAHDLLELSLAAMAGMIADLEFVPERMRAAAAAGHATATDLADWLVSEADVPVPRGASYRRPRGRRRRSGGQVARRADAGRTQGHRSAHRRARPAAPVGRGIGRRAALGWRDRAGTGTGGHRRGARRDRGAGGEMIEPPGHCCIGPCARRPAAGSPTSSRRPARACRKSRPWPARTLDCRANCSNLPPQADPRRVDELQQAGRRPRAPTASTCRRPTATAVPPPVGTEQAATPSTTGPDNQDNPR